MFVTGKWYKFKCTDTEKEFMDRDVGNQLIAPWIKHGFKVQAVDGMGTVVEIETLRDDLGEAQNAADEYYGGGVVTRSEFYMFEEFEPYKSETDVVEQIRSLFDSGYEIVISDQMTTCTTRSMIEFKSVLNDFNSDFQYQKELKELGDKQSAELKALQLKWSRP